MNTSYRFEKFVFREQASADMLTADEERFIELYEASRNSKGVEGNALDDESVDRLLDTLVEAHTRVVIDDDDDEVAGVAAYDIEGGRIWLEGLATDRYKRSQGVGSFVISQLVEVAIDNDCTKISLYSQPNGRTVDFYLRHGGVVDDSIEQAGTEYVPITIPVTRK